MNTIFLLFTFFSSFFISNSKIITTSYGKLQGATKWSNDSNHKYMFKKVPFAKPPIGDLRFALPEEPEPWNHVLDATEYSHACMANFTTSQYGMRNISEDCLYINIFTSEKCLTKTCPVIVYYHGGSFVVDTAIMFPDDFILERYVSEDIVFAIPAFRLGLFGQLYFGQTDFLSENLLMFDAQRALHFVHNEIKHFGGDPKRVTIMGHSSGGTMVYTLGFSKMIDPHATLFQQMISLSGAGGYGYEDAAINSSYELAWRVNCKPEKDSRPKTTEEIQSIFECLKSTDSLELLKTQTAMALENGLHFKILTRGAPIMPLNGKISDLKKDAPPRNILCGTTEWEFQDRPYFVQPAGPFLDYDNFPEIYEFWYNKMNGTHLMDPVSADVYIATRTYCEAMANAGANAFIHETRQKPFSGHLTDMQFFIGIHREKVHTPDMDILDSFYSKMIVNFTKTGVPSPEWEKLDPSKMNYLELKVDSEKHEGPKMLEGYHDDIYEIWMGPIAELDRNITEQKRRESHHLENSTSHDMLLTEGFSILNQWWFYAIIILILVVAIAACFTCFRRGREEETPLLR